MKTKCCQLLMVCLFPAFQALAQSNIIVTNPLANQLMLGNYNPADYSPITVINDPDQIICGIRDEVSTDSLLSYFKKLSTFHTRNTGSDTVSATTGIGAARRWAYGKFQEFSAANENRLITSYLQFNKIICGMSQHRNTFTVLPGSDTTDKSIIIIEAHLDSRCEVRCDINCKAHGIEDNGSGSALVLELARVMSKYTFNHTLVFMLTIGEEQGLHGADAFSLYAVNNGIEIEAVQNNDIVGGIICGKTSSPPSCPFENHIDSTNVRIFSATGLSRGYAQFVKINHEQKLLPILNVPMSINIINQEDRSGRGGDHIPFREDGYTAIRYCSANEHGDADTSNTPYTDRQHTTTDVLGIDTDLDGEIDSFFVDFNYLKRNVIINAFGATIVDIAPEVPGFQITSDITEFSILITNQTQYSHYRVGIRSSSSTGAEFEALYSFYDTLYFAIPNIQNGVLYYVSVASVDNNGITGPFSGELIRVGQLNTNSAPADTIIANPFNCSGTGIDDLITNGAKEYSGIELLPCKPNPFIESTIITVIVNKKPSFSNAYILISDITGREILKIDIGLDEEVNEVLYKHGNIVSGIYTYSLVIDEKVIQTRKVVFSH